MNDAQLDELLDAVNPVGDTVFAALGPDDLLGELRDAIMALTPVGARTVRPARTRHRIARLGRCRHRAADR